MLQDLRPGSLTILLLESLQISQLLLESQSEEVVHQLKLQLLLQPHQAQILTLEMTYKALLAQRLKL